MTTVDLKVLLLACFNDMSACLTEDGEELSDRRASAKAACRYASLISRSRCRYHIDSVSAGQSMQCIKCVVKSGRIASLRFVVKYTGRLGSLARQAS